VISDCNGNQAIYNPPFNSPLSYTIPGIDSDGTTNCSITAQFTADPACSFTISPFNYPSGCVCEAEIGTFTDNLVGNGTNTNPWFLCFGDELDIIGNGDFVGSQNFNLTGVTHNPGVWLAVYSCPPTVFPPNDINTDPCLIGVASTADQAWTIANTVGNGQTLYYVPITMYSMVNGIYAISINGGNWCYDMGPTYPVTFLPQITTNITQNCQAGTASVTVSGGLPAVNGSQFTGSNLTPANASFASGSVNNGGTFVLNGLVDGDNWSFTITDGNGCPVVVSGTFQGLEDASFTYPDNTYCQTQLNPSPTVTGTPGGTFTASPAGLSINAVSGLINLGASTPGTYTITYTTPDPICFDTEQFIITINPVPVITPQSNVTACDTYTLPAITGTSLTGNQAYFTGPNGTGTQLAPGSVINTPGLTTIYIFDQTGTIPNCFDEESFTVTINVTPILNPIPSVEQCSPYTLPAITGTNLTGNQAYYTAPNGGGTQLSPGSTISTLGANTIYIYDATGTNPNCFDQESFVVTINIFPDIDPITAVEVCDAFTLPVITGNNLTGGQAYFTAPNGGGTQLNAGAVISSQGVNTIYIYDETGTTPNCFDEQVFTVTINLTPNINPVASIAICDEFTLPAITGANLTGNQAYYTAPNGGGTVLSAGAIISAPGANTIYIYDQTGTTPNCFDQESFTVTISLTPDINPIANDVVCDSYTFPAITGTNLTGTQAYYTAPNGGGTSFQPGATYTTPGTTTFYIYDATGTTPNCFDEESFTVTINVTPVIVLSYTDPSECGLADGTITMSGLQPNTSYAVTYSVGGVPLGPQNITTDGAGNLVIPNLAAGTYSGFVLTLNGCTTTDNTSLNLVEPNAPIIDAGVDQTVCDGVQVTLTANNPDGANITWSNGVANGVAFNSPVGTTSYTVTANLAGCISSDQVLVTVNPIPQIGAGSDQTLCDGDLITLTAVNPDGANVSWNNGVTNGVAFNQPVGTTTYTVTADLLGCINTDQVNVTINPNPQFTAAGTNPTTCGGNDGTLVLSGLTPGATYQVSYSSNGNTVGPNNLVANANGQITIIGLTAGTYTSFSVTLNNCNTVVNTVINLLDPNAPFVDAGPDVTVCEGQGITLTANNPDGAVITWNNGVTNGVQFNQNVGTITYTVTANLAGCISTDQVTVLVHPNPTVFAGNDVIVCEGQSVVLTGSGAQTYTWNNGVTNGVPFVPTATQTYTVTGTSQFGCIGTDQVVVTLEALPVVSFVGDNLEGCTPVTTTFTNTSSTPGNNCTWYLSNGAVLTGCNNVSYTFTQSGCYSVTLEVQTVNGCTSSATYSNYVCVEPYPIANFTYSPNQITTINTDIDFQNGSIGANNYQWFFGDGGTSSAVNPTHTYPEIESTFNVMLVATSNFGCADTAYAVINILEELIFYVPNTFTPDANGVNEIFKPVFTSGFDPFNYHLMIFNRWGEIIFESYDANFGWDGTYGVESNEPVKDGTYVWKIEFKTKLNDERKMYVGHVNVLK
jgi:gliding motility-associated-like protein